MRRFNELIAIWESDGANQYNLVPKGDGFHEIIGQGIHSSDVLVGEDSLMIYGISTDSGNGYMRKFLTWARDRYDIVGAINIGYEWEAEESAWTFWTYMFEQGLVDYLEDDDGMVVRER